MNTIPAKSPASSRRCWLAVVGWLAAGLTLVSGQTLLYTNGGNWNSGSGVDTGWTDASVEWSGTNGHAGATDPCFWLPVNMANKDSTGGVHCQVQLYQINHVFWSQPTNQPLQSPYARRFNFAVRFDTQNGNTLAGANQWDINLLQFWQWATPWTNNGVPQQWVNGQPEFMLWVANNSYGRQYIFKIYTDVPNVANGKGATEWLLQNTTDHPVTLEDGNWHAVSVYGSLSTNAVNACVTVSVDGVPVNWDRLTKTVIDANGNRGTPQVLAGPGTNITGCATLPDWGDFRPRFGAYAYHKFGSITNFGLYLDDIAILSNAVYYVPPTLAAVANQAVLAGAELAVTNAASDANLPALPLGYRLALAPAGASVNPTNGVIRWRPPVATSGTSQPFTVTVTNAAGLAASRNFVVNVVPPPSPTIAGPVWRAGQLTLTVSGDAGPDYLIQTTTNLKAPDWQTVFVTNAPALPFQWTDAGGSPAPARFYRVMLGP